MDKVSDLQQTKKNTGKIDSFTSCNGILFVSFLFKSILKDVIFIYELKTITSQARYLYYFLKYIYFF